MSVNKNFVVKNGFEVSTDLILANATTKKVGIGSTNPRYKLDVAGGIGATDSYISGISTVINQFNVGTGGTIFSVLGVGGSIGIATATPAYLLDVRSPVSTGQTAIYVYGDARVTGDLVVDDDLTVDEVTTRNINITGLSTFAGITTVTGETLFSKQLSVSGVTTLGVTTATDITAQNLNVSGIGTITTINSTTATITTATITTGTITTGIITNLSGTNVNYTGISTLTNVRGTTLVNTGVTTLGTVQISSGIITATSGVVTYYGDGQYLDNVIRGVGIGTSAGIVGYGATILNFQGPGISTITVSSGIATINITGGGGGSGSASIGIGTTPGSAGFTAGIVTAGNLWYNSNIGRMFIYYDDGDSTQWVDTSPFNVGIITSLVNVSFTPGSAISPSMYFVGDSQTGFFSPSAGQFTIVSSGSSVLNVNPSGINVTGIATASSFVGNLTGTATYSTSAGIATYATTSGVSTSVIGGISSVTQLNVSGISTVGFITATNSYISGISSVGTAITMYGSTGIVSATKYYGDGSSLSGIDATRIVSGLSSVTVASSSTISAYVNGSNIFNVTGTGVTMSSGKRLDVSSYSENVNFLGSVSGTTALDVGTYSVFVADISGSTSVTFTLSGAVSGRLSSATLILIFSGSASRNISLAFNPKYVGGSGPVYSATAVTDIISFFTADAGSSTYVSVVGQGFA